MNQKLLSKLKQVFVLVYLLSFFLFGSAHKALSQTNIAPIAVVDAFGAGQPGWNWPNINNIAFSACGVQDAFVWTAAPPDGTEWMSWTWTTPRTTNKIKIFHAQTTGRFLAGGVLQTWNGSAWVNHFTFSNLSMANCENEFTYPTVTSTRLRITNFVMGPTGQNSNPNFREIEIYDAPLPGGSGPVLPPIANFFPSQATTSTTTDSVLIPANSGNRYSTNLTTYPLALSPPIRCLPEPRRYGQRAWFRLVSQNENTRLRASNAELQVGMREARAQQLPEAVHIGEHNPGGNRDQQVDKRDGGAQARSRLPEQEK
jgi:hypothetical protein